MDKVIISPTIRPPTKSKALEWALRIIMEIPGTMAAQDTSTSAASPDKKPDSKKVAEGEVEAKRLLLLMDRDQSGKVSRQEFMKFMESEFGRLDTNKDGELDVYELTGLRIRRSNQTNHK